MHELTMMFTDQLKFDNFSELVYLVPTTDPQLQWMTFYLAKYVKLAFPTPAPKSAVLLYLPRLHEDASASTAADPADPAADPADPVVTALLGAYHKHHISTREQLYEHIDTLKSYEDLLNDGLFEAMQIAVCQGIFG